MRIIGFSGVSQAVEKANHRKLLKCRTEPARRSSQTSPLVSVINLEIKIKKIRQWRIFCTGDPVERDMVPHVQDRGILSPNWTVFTSTVIIAYYINNKELASCYFICKYYLKLPTFTKNVTNMLPLIK